MLIHPSEQPRDNEMNQTGSSESNDFFVDISHLSQEELWRYAFIDVRETVERLLHPVKEIPSRHYPMSQSPGTNLKLDDSQFYIIFCAKGKRSFAVTKELRSRGLINVFSLKNGTDDFKDYFAKRT